MYFHVNMLQYTIFFPFHLIPKCLDKSSDGNAPDTPRHTPHTSFQAVTDTECDYSHLPSLAGGSSSTVLSPLLFTTHTWPAEPEDGDRTAHGYALLVPP